MRTYLKRQIHASLSLTAEIISEITEIVLEKYLEHKASLFQVQNLSKNTFLKATECITI